MTSKKLFLQVTILFLSLMIWMPSLFAQQKFTLMGKHYRHEGGKWYTFFQGRIGDEIIPNRVIVRLTNKGDMNSFNFKSFNITGVSVMSRRFLDGYYVLLVETQKDPFQIATQLEQTGRFAVLDFDAYGQNAGTPNDVHFPDQWNLHSDKLNLEQAWDITAGNSEVILAIVDNGAKYDHEDLADNIWVNPAEDINGNSQPDFAPVSQGGDEDGLDNDGNDYTDDLIGWNFFSDTNLPKSFSHGTNVTGIAAARTNNSVGVAGVAGGWGSQKGVSLMILDDAEPNTQAPTKSTMAMGIEYAADNGASIINISQIFQDTASVVQSAIDYATSNDVAVFCAAGNFGGDATTPDSLKVLQWPARYPNAISVGATTQNDERWNTTSKAGSMIGDIQAGGVLELDVVAPGPDGPIWTTESDGGYTSGFGKTSGATSHASGVAALMLSINLQLSWSDVRDILRNTADKVPAMNGANYTDELGYGRVNAYEALKYTLENYGGTLSGEVTFTEDLNVTNGVTITIEEGTTVKLAPGVDLWFRDDSRLVAVGSASEPITFTSTESTPGASEYGTIYLFGNNNQLEYCTVEYADWGVKIHGNPSYTTGNVVKNCTFHDNDQGLRIHNSTVTVDNSTLEDNRHAFVILDNADVTITDCTVEHNGRDGIYTGGSVIDVFDSSFEFNGEGDVSSIHGIYALSGSDIYLGSRIYGTVGGNNLIRDNRGAGVLVKSGGLVTAGIVHAGETLFMAADNSIYNNGTKSGTYNGKDFYNESSTTMWAEQNYWGGNCPPTSQQIFGSVDTDFCLSAPPGAAPIFIESATKSDGRVLTEDDTQIKKNLIATYKQTISTQPNSQQAVDAIQQYYSLVRSDDENKLGERSIVNGYLNSVYTTHQNKALGLTALQLMILEERRTEDLVTAISLSESAIGLLQGEEKAGVMFNLVFMYLQVGDLNNAQRVTDDYKKQFSRKIAEIEILEGELARAQNLQVMTNSTTSTLRALSSPSPQSRGEKSGMRKLGLESNYPNPFNPQTTIRYQIPQRGKVTLNIYNLLGEAIRTLVDDVQAPGVHSVRWDGKDRNGVEVASGVYVSRLQVGERVEARKMLLVR